MKTNNIIPIVCGCVALIVCIGIIATWSDVINGFATAESDIAAIFSGIGISVPFISFMACIYFIVKPKK